MKPLSDQKGSPSSFVEHCTLLVRAVIVRVRFFKRTTEVG